MNILAIDPGDVRSAMVLFDCDWSTPVEWWLADNVAIRQRLDVTPANLLAVEYTPPYTLTTRGGSSFVPNQVVLTAIELGKFIERWSGDSELVSRVDVKKHLLGRTTGNDAAVRQAIMDRYGGTRETAVGRKASPGPLFGIKNDLWAALAVAITYQETMNLRRQPSEPTC